jgi:MraZ protein
VYRGYAGTFEHKLDAKGRMFLPAKFRERFAEGLVLTMGQERCLYVWDVPGFETFAGRLDEAPMTNRRARDYQRMLFAGASDEVPDAQGRVIIPGHLRKYAALERECFVIGARDHVEIWDATAWSTYLSESEQAYSDQSEEVFPGF